MHRAYWSLWHDPDARRRLNRAEREWKRLARENPDCALIQKYKTLDSFLTSLHGALIGAWSDNELTGSF